MTSALADENESPASLLTEPLLQHIASFLPTRDLARSLCVCRAWAASLSAPSLWQELRLAGPPLLSEVGFTKVLSCAVPRAAGLLSIDVTDQSELGFPTLCACARRLPLKVLRMSGTLELYVQPHSSQVRDLLAVAHFTCLVVDVICDASRALPLLLREGVYAPVQVVQMSVVHGGDVRPLLRALGTHPLRSLGFHNCAMSLDALEEVVDVVLQRRMSCLQLESLALPAGAGPLFQRLLRGDALTHLTCRDLTCAGDGTGNEEEDWLEHLASALPANTSLVSLDLQDCAAPPAFATDVLLPAVRANAALRRLRVVPGDGAPYHARCEAELLVRHRAEAERMAAHRQTHSELY